MADPVINASNFSDYNSYLQSDQQRQLANDLATQEYNKSKAAGEAEDRALAAAKFAWQQTMDRAGLTGRFEDSWTFPSQQWFTTQFGEWMPGGPQAGQLTLGAQKQAADFLGTYQGAQTLSAQQQAWNQAQQAAAAAAAATGYWQQPTGTGNMAMDAFNTRASPQERQEYLAATRGDQQAAADRFLQNSQAAVRARTEAVGAEFTPDTMRQWVYGQGTAGQSGPWGGGGQRTLTAQEQDYTQWLRATQEARANQTAQQATAQKYLELLSSLRGPADWAKYQQVLGSTPGGMRDLAAAAMGQYIPGGGATTGYQPQAANLNTLQGDVAGYGQQGYAAFTPGGQIQQAAAQQPQTGQNQQVNALGNGTNMYGAPQQNQMNLPAPNQIAPQSWNALAPSQREMIKGQYEAQGWYAPDVEALMNQALPKYASNAPSAGTWRLK